MASLSKENYLKALFHLADENNQISVKDLSEHLNIKMPSVNSMMKKFAINGWVIYENYKPIVLTPEGYKGAALIVRKHRLTEMFLVEKMGFGWEEVHDIAEELEHIHSELFFDKIDQMLHYPKTDPHGSPIPDKQGNIDSQSHVPLSKCQINDEVIFVALEGSSDDFLKFLNNKNLSLGTKITVLSCETFDESKKIKYLDREENFSKIILDKILVEKR